MEDSGRAVDSLAEQLMAEAVGLAFGDAFLDSLFSVYIECFNYLYIR